MPGTSIGLDFPLYNCSLRFYFTDLFFVFVFIISLPGASNVDDADTTEVKTESCSLLCIFIAISFRP